MGIEPTLAAWEAAVLPLNYTRVRRGLCGPAAAGCNAIGIAGSLLIGEWMAELVLEGRTGVDTSSQALDRFGPRYRERRRLREACESIYGNFYSLDKGAF